MKILPNNRNLLAENLIFMHEPEFPPSLERVNILKFTDKGAGTLATST